jgi:uronate dehydrogenase
MRGYIQERAGFGRPANLARSTQHWQKNGHPAMASTSYRVLVTGAAGAIGQPVCAELVRRGHHVRALDLVASPGIEDQRVGSIEDAELVRSAMEGMDTVVHLAAMPNDADFPLLVGPNVIGLYNVLNAARAANARRVVLASSVQVVSGARDLPRPLTADVRRPSNHYALTKIWAEQMAEMYARRYGLSSIVARVCWMVRDVAEARRLHRWNAGEHYLSRADAGRFFACAIEAKDIDFAILYAVGPDGDTFVDLETAKNTIGYLPTDHWPDGLPFPFPLPDLTDEQPLPGRKS